MVRGTVFYKIQSNCISRFKRFSVTSFQSGRFNQEEDLIKNR